MKKRIQTLIAAALMACIFGASASAEVSWKDMTFDEQVPLLYATQFTVAHEGDDYTLLTIGTDQTFLVVDEGAPVPSDIDQNVTILQKPLDHIYLVATAAMDYFGELNAVDHIRLSSLREKDWYIESAKAAMQSGEMVYAGKYSAPDYETVLANSCDLVIENTMIYHTPEVIEQMQSLGIPVLVERSSYESNPLGRMEWLKFYAALVDKEDEAETYFESLMQSLEGVIDQTPTGKSVAFFYITTSGAVNVRKSGDYVAKAIAMAGGEYVLFDESQEENALSTMTVQMESFYNAALDADVLIYNSNIDAEMQTMDQLLSKSPLLADFKAVQEGNVWCVSKNFYQEALGIGNFILDVHAVLTGNGNDELLYLHKLT